MTEVGICILNYNMPEATDALVKALHTRVEVPYKLNVLDNGSDIVSPSTFTTMFLEYNQQTTAGWLYYLSHTMISKLDYVWLLITSNVLDPKGECPLTPLVDFLDHNPNAVAIHPALTEHSTTSWTHLKTRGGNQPERHG